jgi:hypothetical protein
MWWESHRGHLRWDFCTTPLMKELCVSCGRFPILSKLPNCGFVWRKQAVSSELSAISRTRPISRFAVFKERGTSVASEPLGARRLRWSRCGDNTARVPQEARVTEQRAGMTSPHGWNRHDAKKRTAEGGTTDGHGWKTPREHRAAVGQGGVRRQGRGRRGPDLNSPAARQTAEARAEMRMVSLRNSGILRVVTNW